MLNPRAASFNPAGYGKHNYQQNGKTPQMVDASGPDVKGRVLKLEHDQVSLRTDVEALKALCNSLSTSVGKLEKGRWAVNVGPSHHAMQLRQELEKLRADGQEFEGKKGFLKNVNGFDSTSLPSHLRIAEQAKFHGAVAQAQAENTKSEVDRLATDGLVDTPGHEHQRRVPEPAPTPPASPPRDRLDPSIKQISHLKPCDGTLPHFLKNLPALPNATLQSIPSKESIISFSADFLLNTFGGITWSPGLRYIPPGSGPCLLKSRTYYMLNTKYEPFLPKAPGGHGAKLTAFFNTNPEDEFGDLDEGASYLEVPTFIALPGGKRYVYFGHYSQTRWSDKLDYDHMVSIVPDYVKNFWADELVAVGRPDWLTTAIMKHFFPKPEYEGRLFGSTDEGTMTTEDESTEGKVMKDVKEYVQQLKEWEKDAKMKSSMVKKEFILQAFEQADADDPPSLRLWWEYLECVDWKKDFYDMLVTLQSRDKSYVE